jgi:hypothetical protein
MFTLLRATRPSLDWAQARAPRLPGLSRVISGIQTLLSAIDTCRVPVPVPIPVPRRPRLGTVALGLSAMLIAGTSLPLSSFAAVQWGSRSSQFESTADGQLVDVQVLVDGNAAPLYLSPRSSDRQYFQAFQGRNYALSVHNTTGRRVGVLISVDGLNVVNGERSTLANNESMYVLDPYETAVIRGWRSSLRDIQKFVFVDEQRSYAERTGQANGDMGWIRVLAFRERQQRADWGRNWMGLMDGPRAQAPAPAPSSGEAVPFEGDDRAQAAPQDGAKREAAPETNARDYAGGGQKSNPGTGWGDRQFDPVREVRFIAESQATDHLVLRYEYASGLQALGIYPVQFRDRTWEREHGQLGFAKPPRW